MKVQSVATALAAVLLAGPAAAQSSFMADVIGQTVANMNAGIPDNCFDGSREPTEKQAARFTAEAESALRAYLELASTGSDLTPAFTDRKYDRRWGIDGTAREGKELNLSAIRDPWATRVVRLEQVGLRLGAMKVRGRALWKAYAADGSELGTYDALFRRKTKGFEVSTLDLYSAGAATQAPPVTGFCYTPGDVEEWREAREKRAAEKAARRAERDRRRLEAKSR